MNVLKNQKKKSRTKHRCNKNIKRKEERKEEDINGLGDGLCESGESEVV